MQPAELRADAFIRYPSLAKDFAVKNLGILRSIPLALLPVILRQIIDYDWRFPMEQRELTSIFMYLGTLSPKAFNDLMAPFAALRLPPELAQVDWVNYPKRFTENLSAALWSLHEIDEYHKASEIYQQQMQKALGVETPATPRLSIAVIGQGETRPNTTLFRHLRQHGTLFTKVNPTDGLQTLFDAVNARAQKHPESYAHWYIDGGMPDPTCSAKQGVTVTSYGKLASIARQELNMVDRFVKNSKDKETVGAEAVSSYMGSIRPEDLSLGANSTDPVLQRFELSLLTEGSGTQVFSTTFVQWASRQCLQRAQPITLLARFAPRQYVAPMNELLSRDATKQPVDVAGSLVDGDMGAYYNWINQSRLPGAETSRFLAWFEGHGVAMAITPALPKNTTSDSLTNMQEIMKWIS